MTAVTEAAATRRRVLVRVVLVNRGRILLIAGPGRAGEPQEQWRLPRGGLGESEDPGAAARRVVSEQVGMEMSDGAFVVCGADSLLLHREEGVAGGWSGLNLLGAVTDPHGMRLGPAEHAWVSGAEALERLAQAPDRLAVSQACSLEQRVIAVVDRSGAPSLRG